MTTVFESILEDEIFMWQPEGCVGEGPEHLVCRLKRSLHGLAETISMLLEFYRG